ncbi:MAG: EamA family transporter [Clostridia bacterium]|nr:EamA family transporter [Clostridia bacterium]
MSKRKSSFMGSLLVILAACLWGCTGLFVEEITAAGLGSMDIVVLRGIAAALVLAPIMLAVDPNLFRIRLRDAWCFVGSGILSMLFFNYCYYTNIQESGKTVAVVLLFTFPVFVVLLSRLFFKEKITWKKMLAVVLIVVGCALASGIVGADAHLSVRGLLIGLASGFGYSLYTIFSRCALDRHYSPLTITFYTFLLSAVGGAFFTDFRYVAEVAVSHGMDLWGPLLTYVLIGTVGAYLMYTAGLRHIDTSTAAMLKAAEPASTAILQILVQGIWPDTVVLVGVGVIVAAIVVLNWKKRK